MLIYELKYEGEKLPNVFSDTLAFINSNQEDYLFFKIMPRAIPEKVYAIFSENYYEHFSPLLELYEAKKLDKLPEFESATPLGGNWELLTKNQR